MFEVTIYAHQKAVRIFVSVYSIFIILAAFSGCASNRGKLEASSETTKLFETGQVLADHIYYYSGFERLPYALIGIRRDYTFHSSIWKQIEINPILLKQWVYKMSHVYRTAPQGAIISGPAGEHIGMWYSAHRWTTVRLEKDNRVVVVPPEPPELRGIP